MLQKLSKLTVKNQKIFIDLIIKKKIKFHKLGMTDMEGFRNNFLMIKMSILKWFLTVMLGFIESICELFQKYRNSYRNAEKDAKIARLDF